VDSDGLHLPLNPLILSRLLFSFSSAPTLAPVFSLVWAAYRIFVFSVVVSTKPCPSPFFDPLPAQTFPANPHPPPTHPPPPPFPHRSCPLSISPQFSLQLPWYCPSCSFLLSVLTRPFFCVSPPSFLSVYGFQQLRFPNEIAFIFWKIVDHLSIQFCPSGRFLGPCIPPHPLLGFFLVPPLFNGF